MPTPMAYFLTWSCYGTWLHGDDRGSVDAGHNRFGSSLVPADPARASRAVERQRFDSVSLMDPMRRVVRDAIIDRCVFTGATLGALSVRTTHVHAVVKANADADAVLAGFKARSTRLLREAGLGAPERPVWTEHGSTRYLWDGDSVGRAIRYVTQEQGAVDEFTVRGRLV